MMQEPILLRLVEAEQGVLPWPAVVAGWGEMLVDTWTRPAVT